MEPQQSIKKYSSEYLETHARLHGLVETAKLVENAMVKRPDLTREEIESNRSLNYSMVYLTWVYTDFHKIIPKRYVTKAQQMVLSRQKKHGWVEAVKLADELCELFFFPA